MSICNIEILEGVYHPLLSELCKGIYGDHYQVHLPEAFLLKSIALLDGKELAAHLSIYHNPNLKYQDRSIHCIGAYECIDDINISTILLEKAVEELKQLGADQVIGPMNGSTWESYRFGDQKEDGFFLEPKHPSYYVEQFETFGFESVIQYQSNLSRNFEYGGEKIEALEQSFRKDGIKFRNIDIDNYEKELERVHAFCLEAFEKNVLYTPISLNAFMSKYLPFKNALKEEFIIMAEDEGDLVGLFFCIPDFYYTIEKRLIGKTLARKRGRTYAGMGNVLVHMMHKIIKEKGYDSFIHALMLTDNHSKSMSEHHYQGNVLSQYHLYHKCF